MFKKRESEESNDDEQTNEASDKVFQQEDNDEGENLVSPRETMLQHLPIELLADILIKAVVLEVRGMRLQVRSVWKEKTDLLISRHGTVCSTWNDILTTSWFRTKVHRILEDTADRIEAPFRLELLQNSSDSFSALDLTTMRDEMFLLCRKGFLGYALNVYDLNDIKTVKNVIPLPTGYPLCIAAKGSTNCVYLLNKAPSFQVSVFCIKKIDDHQFNISPMISNLWLPNPTLSVAATGEIILSRWHIWRKHDRGVISIYDITGSLRHEMRLSSEFSRIGQIIPKSNANLLLVYTKKLIEIDLHGNILRRFLLSGTCIRRPIMKVSQADVHGRILMLDYTSRRTCLLDSEFNTLEFTCPNLSKCLINFMSVPLLRYNRERNEIVCRSPDDDGLAVLRVADH